MQIKDLFAYVCARDAAGAIAFYQDVFGAKETLHLDDPSGRVGHAELDFGGTTLMISDEFPDYGVMAPPQTGPRTFQLHVHVDNADALIARAVERGAVIVQKIADHFYGERSGTIRDPFGIHWNIGHQIEAVSPAEMQRRYDETAGDA